jgi:hypothetical protein
MATAKAKAKAKKAPAAPKKSVSKPKPKPKPKAKDDGPKQLFVDAVREHDFKCKDAGDAWAKTKYVTLMLAWLVGEQPTRAGTDALGRLLDHVRGELSSGDHKGADAGRAVLERAIAGTVKVRNRAAFDLAGLRDEAVVAKKPALAAFVDALAHTAEALASHADGDTATPVRRGIEVGRSLLFSLAERRKGDGEDRAARAAVSRELADELRKALPRGPA